MTAQPTAEKRDSTKRYRVLFVDDDPTLLSALGDYFAKVGHEVFRANNGEEGLATYERSRPDVVIMDLVMPGMSGLQLLEAIRRINTGAVCMVLTGYGEVEAAVDAMRLGAENFLVKPVDMRHLVVAVEKAAEKAALRTENVELRRRLKPNLARTVRRWAAVAILLAASAGVGKLIGNLDADAQPRAPIPVPITGDTAKK